ncbi:MAG TPA: hypothetical protein VLC93_19910, partial [Myxococcota bacterium]|nr:hypothetical protein [Myxococcota bacterium]
MARRLVAGALICVLAPSVACSRSGFLDDGLQAGGSAPAVTLSTPGLTASREVELSIVCRSPDGSMLVTQSTARPAANDPRWVACAGTAGHTLSGADGLYTIAVWGRDAGGAISDAPGTTQVTLDTTPPNLRWVRAPPAFVAGAAPFSLTWSTTEPHVAPLASFAVEVSVDGGASWSLLTPVQASATAMNDHVSGTDWQVPATDASQALVRVSLSDAVGNTAAPVVSTPFGIDGQPPVLEDFLLAGGAASTASAEVTVAINASDASPMEARLSASPVFTDAGWLPLTSLTSTQLPGANGPKAVYLWIRDAVGHVTPMTARAITLAVSEAWTTIGFVERDGIVASTSGAQTLTLRLAATRLQDVHVTLEVLGDAVYGLDHDLENGREITIPAGQVTAPVTFDVFDARPGTTWWARMEVRAIAVDSPRVRIDDTATTRLGIRSSGAPLTVSRHAMNFEATNGCAVLSDGTLV